MSMTEEQVAVPEGWQLVPVEPTWEMVQAATHSSVAFGTKASYKAMLAAAPKQKDEWVNATDRLPDVGKGDELHCFVYFQNSRTGKASVFDCYYVNKPIPDDDDDCELVDDDGSPIDIVGWHFKGAHPDYRYYYEPVAEGVTHWRKVTYPAAPLTEGGAS